MLVEAQRVHVIRRPESVWPPGVAAGRDQQPRQQRRARAVDAEYHEPLVLGRGRHLGQIYQAVVWTAMGNIAHSEVLTYSL